MLLEGLWITDHGSRDLGKTDRAESSSEASRRLMKGGDASPNKVSIALDVPRAKLLESWENRFYESDSAH